jgi:hypothetical protein
MSCVERDQLSILQARYVHRGDEGQPLVVSLTKVTGSSALLPSLSGLSARTLPKRVEKVVCPGRDNCSRKLGYPWFGGSQSQTCFPIHWLELLVSHSGP